MVYGLLLKDEVPGHISITFLKFWHALFIHVSGVIYRTKNCAVIYNFSYSWSSINNQGQSRYSFFPKLLIESLGFSTLMLWTEPVPCYTRQGTSVHSVHSRCVCGWEVSWTFPEGHKNCLLFLYMAAKGVCSGSNYLTGSSFASLKAFELPRSLI